MAASSRELDYEEISVEYESKKSVTNYTSDTNDTSFEASTTPSDEISSDNSDNDDLDSSRLENIHSCMTKNHFVILHTLIE